MSNETVFLDDEYDAWALRFKPVENHLVEDAAFSGLMFETFGNEVEHVKKQPDEHVWTWIEGDGGTFIVSGPHFVNRLGYFITEQPWDEFVEFRIDQTFDDEAAE